MNVLLFANGIYTPQDEEWIRALPHELLIAVNGGLHRLQHLGLRPHVYIVDEDSVHPARTKVLEEQGVMVLRFPQDKDQTDLELAALYAVKRGGTTLHFFGALGGRWDQSLANLLLVLHPELRGKRLCFYADGQRLFPIYREFIVRGEPGDTVSFLPIFGPVRGITLRGFRYPLRGGEILPGSTLGVSNVLDVPAGYVSIEEGVLLGIHIPQSIQTRIEFAKHPNRGGES